MENDLSNFQISVRLAPLFAALGLLLSTYGPALAQSSYTPTPADHQLENKIDNYLNNEMRRYKIPGVALAVLRDGKISLLKNYGLANVELRVPVKPETIFQSGSIGKQFTAAAIMILVQEGRVSLDDKISKYLPSTPDSWKDITIKHLLTHTSGMGDYPDEISLRGDYTEDQYLEIFKKAPLNFAPGTKWDYSNVGYVTLGILISKITGRFYGEFLKEKLFKPLRMSTARIISEADIVANRAAGYRSLNGELKNQEWVSPSTNSTADGSFYVSILDMAKWDEALTRGFSTASSSGNKSQNESVFARSTLEQMWTPVKLSDGRIKSYGFGWFTDTLHNRRLVFHGGAWQGFKSQIIRFLDEKLTIIFLANSWETNDFKLARGLISIFHPEFRLEATSNPVRPTDGDPVLNREPKVNALIHRVLMQLTNDRPDKSLFTSDFQTRFFPIAANKLGETLRTLSLPVAVIHLSELVERRTDQNLRLYKYELTDIGKTLVCTLKLTDDDKIASLELVSKRSKL